MTHVLIKEEGLNDAAGMNQRHRILHLLIALIKQLELIYSIPNAQSINVIKTKLARMILRPILPFWRNTGYLCVRVWVMYWLIHRSGT